MRVQTTTREVARGFSLVEVLISVTILVLVLLALSGSLLLAKRNREELSARRLVHSAVRTLTEEIRAASPSTLVASYDAQSHTVAGVDGLFASGDSLWTSVDDSVPELLEIDINGSWSAGGRAHSVFLQLSIHATGGP